MNEIAIDIKNNIENIMYTMCYRSTEEDLNDLLKECLRMAELLILMSEKNENC